MSYKVRVHAEVNSDFERLQDVPGVPDHEQLTDEEVREARRMVVLLCLELAKNPFIGKGLEGRLKGTWTYKFDPGTPPKGPGGRERKRLRLIYQILPGPDTPDRVFVLGVSHRKGAYTRFRGRHE